MLNFFSLVFNAFTCIFPDRTYFTSDCQFLSSVITGFLFSLYISCCNTSHFEILHKSNYCAALSFIQVIITWFICKKYPIIYLTRALWDILLTSLITLLKFCHNLLSSLIFQNNTALISNFFSATSRQLPTAEVDHWIPVTYQTTKAFFSDLLPNCSRLAAVWDSILMKTFKVVFH